MGKVFYDDAPSKKVDIFFISVGVLVSLIVSLGLILLFALFIKWFGWGNGVIMPANIIIKILSVSVGVIFAVKDGRRGAVKGAIAGLLYIILCTFVFSILNKHFSFDKGLLYDILLGTFAGMISGVIFVNLKR